MTTITIDGTNILINSITLEELLDKVYQRGKTDSRLELEEEKVTFVQLSKELADKGKKIGVQSLSNRAKKANIKIETVDGKRKGVYRRDIKKFVIL